MTRTWHDPEDPKRRLAAYSQLKSRHLDQGCYWRPNAENEENAHQGALQEHEAGRLPGH